MRRSFSRKVCPSVQDSWQCSTFAGQIRPLRRVFTNFLANGTTTEEILAEYPQLTEEDIRAAIAYGAEMSRERYVDFLTEAAG